MEGPLEPRPPGDPALIRISDRDRHQVAEILREAAAEGRIDLDELDERLEAAYAAKTYADLVPITVDLPARHGDQVPIHRPQQQPDLPAARHNGTVSIFGGVTRKGPWELGETHTAFAFCAGIDLDLREARFTGKETVIYAHAIWAGIDIVVNEHTNVIVDGIGIMGGYDHARDKVAPALGPDSPTVRVKGIALMGAVTVQRRAMPGQAKHRWLPRR